MPTYAENAAIGERSAGSLETSYGSGDRTHFDPHAIRARTFFIERTTTCPLYARDAYKPPHDETTLGPDFAVHRCSNADDVRECRER